MGKPVALSHIHLTHSSYLKWEWWQVQLQRLLFKANVNKCGMCSHSYRVLWSMGHGGYGFLFQTCIPHSYICGKVKVCGPPWNLWETKHVHCHSQCYGNTVKVHATWVSVDLCIHSFIIIYVINFVANYNYDLRLIIIIIMNEIWICSEWD